MLSYIESDKFGVFGSWEALYKAYGMTEDEFNSFIIRATSDGTKQQIVLGDVPYADWGTDEVEVIDYIWSYGEYA